MTHNKRKKVSRQRGSWTHGGGEKKKRRGAGHRGGRGNAGSGKKGDAKKTMFWKDTEYFGKHGFVNVTADTDIAINISKLEEQIENFLKTKHASKSGDIIKINLHALGFTKLLGAGTSKTKFDIAVNKASESAVKKIEALGGKVNIGSNKPKTEQKVQKETKSISKK
ncbi:uL15 family ribosomal protein [Candidatus Woesearchaeota archaeon]|nr:uL15 family ribosomal protein [Candidatus Woesearchaeota archaeon]MCF7901359.1 uL15 family ribosomal protein [Candidatus Woesearchaeota archaeon]MCF8013359.1 uL15 family ribosomal protein [Candidatus Woesearchaeota archaeon]